MTGIAGPPPSKAAPAPAPAGYPGGQARQRRGGFPFCHASRFTPGGGEAAARGAGRGLKTLHAASRSRLRLRTIS